MTAAVAYAAAPAAVPCPETPRASTGARPRAGGGFRIRVPLRLVVGGQYGDAALAVYIKIAALSVRAENCRAKVATLAEYLSLSKSAVERALTQLTTTGTDGIAEVLTRRITSRDGEGESAERWVRPMEADELFVWLPARAATSLPPRQLRLYAVIAYAQIRRMPLSLAELRAVVRHQYGDSAGEPLGERQVMRLLDDLESTGWITIHRRQGPRGRHAYEAHQRPLHPVLDDTADEPTTGPVPAAPATATPDIHDGSAPRTADGSPATEEDRKTDRPSTSEGCGGIRRRRDAGSSARGHGEKRSNNGGGTTYRGPGLQLSPRVWQVLEPVRPELPTISPYMLRRIGQEIGRQLSAGVGMERLTTRLLTRYSRLTAHAPATENARRGDVGRWILGAGLPRHGCRLDSCESGTTWSTGERCHLCANIAAEAERLAAVAAEQLLAAAPRPEPPAPVRPPTTWLPMPPPDPGPEPPGPAEREQLRAAATPETVRQALAELGAPAAIRLYGRALVLPHLTEHHDEGNSA
ncbi:helix-turn-helix domain-containing protein [Streptomyces parvus]|uniref:helix-turn-helix domain-containing protein n=1 Tax=Streptomyces parvus TaxID=66428 RepID=UPI00340A8E7A